MSSLSLFKSNFMSFQNSEPSSGKFVVTIYSNRRQLFHSLENNPDITNFFSNFPFFSLWLSLPEPVLRQVRPPSSSDPTRIWIFSWWGENNLFACLPPNSCQDHSGNYSVWLVKIVVLPCLRLRVYCYWWLAAHWLIHAGALRQGCERSDGWGRCQASHKCELWIGMICMMLCCVPSAVCFTRPLEFNLSFWCYHEHSIVSS